DDGGAGEAMLDVSGAVAGRAGRSAGRVKTRLLGFQADDEAKDVFAAKTGGPAPVVADRFPTGWIIVIDGPGRGASFSLHVGVSNIGRGEDQAVRLDFGDTSISRNNHAAVAFDEEQGKFFLGHGGKSNLVRLNGKPVLSTEEMADGDEIRIGETSLKFVALCGEDFSWTSDGDNGEDA
ncbi:MAG: FHA domain-containing protein, partial [Silicimonas sp.]|nr:FHA domain-containing protein [Silicimonas sp.]